MKLFFATLGFLTRLPVPATKEVMPEEKFRQGILFYPLIGLITGFLMALIFFLLDSQDTKMPAAIAAVAVQAVVTGGFHLDGLSDSLDGLFSSRKREQMLEIMRDSRIGAFGVLGLLFDILLKISVFYSLPKGEGILAVLLMPVAGKTITPLLMHSAYARSSNGLGSIYLSKKYTPAMIAAIALGIIIITAGYRFMAIIPIITAAAVAILFRRYCQKVLGGMTGDTLGCGTELCEVAFLLAILYSRRLS